MPATETPLPPPSTPPLKRVERLSYFLDNSIRIPLINYRIGWDALIGLVPGVGDVAGLLLSAYIVVEAARFGVPKSSLMRMVLNVGIEALVGAVPLLGDLFDATWKANARNVALLQAHLDVHAPRQRKADRRFLLGIAGALAGVVLLLVLLLLVLVEMLGG